MENGLAITIKYSDEIRENLLNIDRLGIISSKRLNSLMEKMRNAVDRILSDMDAMDSICDLRLYDVPTYYHSLNVCVLSLVTGTAMDLDEETLYQLGLAAVLHDIGKMFVPRELLYKEGTLSGDEFELIKTHSFKGYVYMRDNFDIPGASCEAILQHHEKFDGNGYPAGCNEDSIGLFARIISIADVYDAITSDRPYRKALPPHEAVEYLGGSGKKAFDPEIVRAFLRITAPYPVKAVICSDSARQRGTDL